MIDRIGIDAVKRYLTKYPVVGIVGPRQVGKTTLAKQLMDDSTIYLDLESDIDQAKLTEPGLFLRSQRDKLIVLDEIQQMPELFPLIRSIVDEDRRPGQFIILGSASPAILRKSSESLAGRVAYFELTPFLISELQSSKEDLWLRGGYPLAYMEEDNMESLEWRTQLIRTYVDRDLPILGLNANRRTIFNFLRMVAHNNGNLWNASAYAKSLGLTSPTVKRYLDFLEGAFILDVLEPFYTNIKKRITKSPKVYFKDTGILHAILKISSRDELDGVLAVGGSWENFVFQQIKGYFGEAYEYFFYRTQDGTELDLVMSVGGIPKIGIEIKYSLAPKVTKGLKLAIEDLKTENNYIITPGEYNYPIHEKISVVGIKDFLVASTTF